MRTWKDGQLHDPRGEQLLRKYILRELEETFRHLPQEDEAYRLVVASLEKNLGRLEEQDSRLAHALGENLAELRRLERWRSFWAGYCHGNGPADA